MTTKKPTKLQVWTNVQEQVMSLLEGAKVSKKFSEELMNLLETNIAPKSGGGNMMNPPKLDEDGNIVEAYCRFHQRYEIVSNMVISNNKSKGYCKASISLWNKTNSKIKSLESTVSKLVSEGSFEEAQVVAKESVELKESFNKPEFYDYDRDLEAFNA